jgi:hypothetical protein
MQRRIVELDALRGLMLVWITCTHLPTVLSRYVNQPLGFFAATEGFIFLSALFTGRIYFSMAEREGQGAMCRQLWMRTLRLYYYQLLLLAFAFVIAAPIAARGNRPAVHNLLDYYFSTGRIHAFLDAALMLYRPPLLDILPIYIIFFALSPFALILGSRLGWRYVFAGSLTVWLLAQFGLRGFVYHLMTRTLGLHIPLNQMGAFNLWAWQLWWLTGLWLGVRWVKDDLHLEEWARRLTIPAAVIALSFLVLRYAEFVDLLAVSTKYAWLLNKWNFGLGRIVDFTAVTLLAVRLRALLKPLAIPVLVRLGQASLPVFCVHLLCVFFALTLLGNRDFLRGWEAVVVLVASFSALLLTARIAAGRRERAGRNRPAGPKIQTPRRDDYEQRLAPAA